MSYEKQFSTCYQNEEAMFAPAAAEEISWDTHLEVSDGSEDWFLSTDAYDAQNLKNTIAQIEAEGLTYTLTEVEA